MVFYYIIIALVAIYGAALSTFTFIANRKEKTQRIKVKLEMGFLAYGPELSSRHFILSALNTGSKTIRLNSIGIFLPNNLKYAIIRPQGDVQFPYDLAEGNKCQVWEKRKNILQSLKENGFSGKVKLVGYYRSALDVVYKSKPFIFDMNEE